jgi:hypothetical protein
VGGYFRIPEYLVPTLLDKTGAAVLDEVGLPKKDLTELYKLLVVFFEANRARIIGRDEAASLTVPGNPCARRDGVRKIRSDRGVFTLPAIKRTKMTAARGISSAMSPRHPRSDGDFRRGAYFDLLDRGGNPQQLLVWAKQRHDNDGEKLRALKESHGNVGRGGSA